MCFAISDYKDNELFLLGPHEILLLEEGNP
jgi:hypothetical protein